MSFNYNLSTAVGRVRFLIGDTVAGQGCLPGKVNFQDEEIQLLIDREPSDDSAAAGGCEVAATAWSKMPDSQSTGPINTSYGQWKHFEGRAIALRAGIRQVLSAGTLTLGFAQTDDGDEFA